MPWQGIRTEGESGKIETVALQRQPYPNPWTVELGRVRFASGPKGQDHLRWARPNKENDSRVVGRGWKQPLFWWGIGRRGRGSSTPVKDIFWALGIGLVSILPGFGEDQSAQRLGSAQSGMAEASWPRKPDDRLSPLSGKMKTSQEISVRYYGKEKEFRGQSAEGWRKEASFGKKANWEGASGRKWEEALWGQDRDWAAGRGESEKFQPQKELASERTLTMREMVRETAEGWSSRTARTSEGREGSLRMYGGRLTRVREQVWREEENPRDLGPGRQEKFSPEEVEKMLAQPLGEAGRAARAQPPAASPPAVADN